MLKVYQCEARKKMIISKDELVLNGWREVVAGSVDAAQEKHVPVVTKKCKSVQVDVGSVSHPMTEEHLIEWVAIETTAGYRVQYLKAGDVPVVKFSLGDEKLVGVYAYCNLHGLWKAD